MYPVFKYSKYPDDIDKEKWKKIEIDFKDKYKQYRSIISKEGITGTTVTDFSVSEYHHARVKSFQAKIDYTIIIQSFPRILPHYYIQPNKYDSSMEEKITDDNLYEAAKHSSPNIRKIKVANLVQLEKILIGEYMVDEGIEFIDTIKLKSDLNGGKLFFDFYEEHYNPVSETFDFIFMNRLLLSPQFNYGNLDVPYNRLRAIYGVILHAL
jgi:hypothetical protein